METVNIFELATSMLVTDDQNEICWRQIWDNEDHFGRHQNPLSFIKSVLAPGTIVKNTCHQYRNSVTNIYVVAIINLRLVEKVKWQITAKITKYFIVLDFKIWIL